MSRCDERWGHGLSGTATTAAPTTAKIGHDTTTTTLTRSSPVLLSLSPDGTTVDATLYAGGVDVIDTTTNAVTNLATSASPMFAPLSGCWIAVLNGDGTRLYMINNSATSCGNSVSVINTDPSSGATYYTVVDTITGLANASAGAFSPDGTRAFVTLGSANEVKVLDTSPSSGTYHQNVNTLTTGTSAGGIVVRADGQHLFVANGGTNTVSIFALA